MGKISTLALFGALSAAAWAGNSFTDEQLKADFYFDLGPSSIDVSAYPKAQQEKYALFARTCSQCHTLARPINAPIVSKKDWKRYITRMRLNTKLRAGTLVKAEDARVIVDFLAYDAKIRKGDRKAEFEARQADLKKLYAEVLQERERRQKEANYSGVKDTPMGATEKPYAGGRYP